MLSYESSQNAWHKHCEPEDGVQRCVLHSAGGAMRVDGRRRRLHIDDNSGPGAERREHPSAMPLLDACRRGVRNVADLLGAQGTGAVHLR